MIPLTRYLVGIFWKMKELTLASKKTSDWDFPGSPMVRTPHFHFLEVFRDPSSCVVAKKTKQNKKSNRFRNIQGSSGFRVM